MLVSVIMPMRNAEKFVKEAACSVLQERSVPIELLIVDDGSNDKSVDIVQGLGDNRIRVVPGPQQGIAACMNTGLMHARGDILMRCDADDLYPEGRISQQIKLLERNPHFIAIAGSFQMIDEDGWVVARPFEEADNTEIEDITNELTEGRLRTTLCAFAIRKQFALQINGFRTFFETAEDLDFVFRLVEAGPIGFSNTNAYLYRIHGKSITHTQPSPRRVYFEELAKNLAAQRKDGEQDGLDLGTIKPLPQDGGIKPHGVGEHLLELIEGDAWREFNKRNDVMAVKQALHAIRRYPSRSKAWRLLILIVVKCGLRKMKLR